MELRVQIPDSVIADLKAKLGHDIKVTDIARDALTLFNWAVQERAEDRFILSANRDGRDVARLALSSLDRVQPNKKAHAVNG
ncbi:hypothetical protein [Paracraurococcus lichenis]|uniref:Uncharacterized protein n=1 Tax=Paracraurococcus lichenis TaxID=3064888 RepID=A0ABT9E7P6_9PROT|nr:hypothetical protein [Paracraurococcus sp. LOR1-02]MDO9712171.1 hypothetical protein [Paracraurococcus sp. LOR1-02]